MACHSFAADWLASGVLATAHDPESNDSTHDRADRLDDGVANTLVPV